MGDKESKWRRQVADDLWRDWRRGGVLEGVLVSATLYDIYQQRPSFRQRTIPLCFLPTTCGNTASNPLFHTDETHIRPKLCGCPQFSIAVRCFAVASKLRVISYLGRRSAHSHPQVPFAAAVSALHASFPTQ